MSVTYVNIPNNPHKHRQFYTTLNNVYLTHHNKDISDGSAMNLISITHNGKLVKAGIDKDVQKLGSGEIYYENKFNNSTNYDEVINEDIFLLYDDAGLNYAHFFFDLFGKCYYFDLLRKEKNNLKLGLPEEFWVDEGKNNFIKQWLKLYYGDDLDVFVFKSNTSYNLTKNIYLPNCFYWFPEGYGHEPILDMIKKAVDKVTPIQVNKNGCYISRQDTIKYGWYHKRDLTNELELIDKIKSELDYDIIELMDYDIVGKIQIFKSYNNIIQQSSASNISIVFSNINTIHTILANPRMAPWMNFKLTQFSDYVKTNVICLNDVGQETQQDQSDGNNIWELTNIDGIMDILKQIDSKEIWN
jgi:hypothetical protein